MMPSLPLKAPAFLLLLALTLTACSKNDRVVMVDDQDPEMTAAIAKARSQLPHFWQTFEKPARGESDFALKVEITDTNGSEHFWTTDLQRTNGVIRGTINNDPNIVKTVKLGSRITIPEPDISDWLYRRDNRMVGNYTIRAMFKKMPAKQVEQLKAILADP